MNLPQQEIDRLLAMGATLGPTARFDASEGFGPQVDAKPEKGRESATLVEPGVAVIFRCDPHVTPAGNYTLIALIPIKTASEINGRDWRKRSGRSKASWNAVSRVLGPHLGLLAPFSEAYRSQRALKVTFTRLGGRKLDRSNLPTATKAVEDALAFMLGADDGDPRWHSSFEQEPGDVGVRIELELFR